MLGVLRSGGSSPDIADAFASKVGGAPTFFPQSSAASQTAAPDTKDNETCASCDGELVLICQVYAPVPGINRSLIILSCPSCGPTATWKVLRSQQPEAALVASTSVPLSQTDNNNAVKTELSPPTPPASVPEPTGTAWAMAAEWGADTDSENEDDINELQATKLSKDVSKEVEGLDEITEMLQQRDLLAVTLLTNTQQQSNNAGLPHARKKKEASVMCRPLDIVEQYAAVVSKDTKLSAHERALLERYNTEQRELGETEIAPGITADQLMQNESRATASNNSRGGGANNSNSSLEAYERIPALDKRLMQFQQHLTSAPTQCIRYDYGGTPMWPAKGNPPAVPKCECCGAKREFEMQLMPPVIDAFSSVVKVKKNNCKNNDNKNASASAADTSGAMSRPEPPRLDGLDFATVLVFSCPESCDGSKQEWSVVVPAI